MASNPFEFSHIKELASIDEFVDIGPCIVMGSPGMLQVSSSFSAFALSSSPLSLYLSCLHFSSIDEFVDTDPCIVMASEVTGCFLFFPSSFFWFCTGQLLSFFSPFYFLFGFPLCPFFPVYFLFISFFRSIPFLAFCSYLFLFLFSLFLFLSVL